MLPQAWLKLMSDLKNKWLLSHLFYDFWKEEMNEPKYFTEKKNTNFQNYSLLNL